MCERERGFVYTVCVLCRPQEDQEHSRRKKTTKKSKIADTEEETECEELDASERESEHVTTIPEQDMEDCVAAGSNSKTKKKKKDCAANGVPDSTAAVDTTVGSGEKLKKKKKKKGKQSVSSSAVDKLSSGRLKSYGL